MKKDVKIIKVSEKELETTIKLDRRLTGLVVSVALTSIAYGAAAFGLLMMPLSPIFAPLTIALVGSWAVIMLALAVTYWYVRDIFVRHQKRITTRVPSSEGQALGSEKLVGSNPSQATDKKADEEMNLGYVEYDKQGRPSEWF